MSAVQASISDTSTPSEVWIPAGTFTLMPFQLRNLTSFTLTIDGLILLSTDMGSWPKDSGGNCTDFFNLDHSNHITIRGTGAIDGQGQDWWVREFEKKNHGRPNMFNIQTTTNLEMYGVKYMNSPAWHLNIRDVDTVYLHDFEIQVDVVKQTELSIKYGFWDFDLKIPTFPLNTDGVDPAGSNIIIRNLKITNFDDAVAVKPANQGQEIAKCSENILVENCTVFYGVGMTIGSVPPNSSHNCVRNVTFRNISFTRPFKAIQVKSNPGDEGDGLIENILYENISIVSPIWWGIQIGPQQQKQPDGAGPGCMIQPINKDCPTNPRVTIRNITLRNVVSTWGVLTPGIIRCDPANPCTGFVFDNVRVLGWFTPFNLGYITENVEGIVLNSTPDPHFKSTDAISLKE